MVALQLKPLQACGPRLYTPCMSSFRIGYGEDAHRLMPGRDLWLGGLKVPDAPHGAVAHSDGDAALHAVSDALLSGGALGDIGQYFPDTDPQYAGLDSRRILARCLALVQERGYAPHNLALVITLDRPKLGPLRPLIAAQLAELLGLAGGRGGRVVQDLRGAGPGPHPGARGAAAGGP